jgi:hypothetical protein
MNGFVLRPENVPPRILDTRGPAGSNFDAYKPKAGQVWTVPVPGGAGKTCAIINIVAVHADAPGFFQAWSSGDERPASSEINYNTGQAIANEVTVNLAPDGSFKMYTSSRSHCVIDLKGYYQPM